MVNKNFYLRMIVMVFLILMFYRVIPIYSQTPQLGEQTLLQQLLNRLPAIPIAGNNLKFQFGGDTWTASLNGKNFLAGSLTMHNVGESSILILKQTHTFVALGWVKTPGPDIILEYREGPPSSLRAISRSELPNELVTTVNNTPSDTDVSLNTVSSSVSAPSQETQSINSQGSILAIFGFGRQFYDYDKHHWKNELGLKWYEYNTVGNGGTLGVNVFFIAKSGFTISIGTDFIYSSEEGGLDVDPIVGLGYVHFENIYAGGIINFIYKPYGQLSPMFGVKSSTIGFKFSLGIGVSIK